MELTVQNQRIYAYTGGKPWREGRPTLVFIHGVLNDHSVWILQSRYFAHHGWNALAIDLPGHGRSEGKCPTSVEEAAAFVHALLQALPNATQAPVVLAGHSWGSLIALHAAAAHPEAQAGVMLVGTAWPMRVSPALLEQSVSDPVSAMRMVNTFSHSTLAPPPSALGPGTWLYGGSLALMRRVLASNPHENIFHTGFMACDSYPSGLEAAQLLAKHQVPVQFILGKLDQMTPVSAAKSLMQALPHARVDLVAAGHQLMLEAPDAVLQAMKAFTQSLPGLTGCNPLP